MCEALDGARRLNGKVWRELGGGLRLLFMGCVTGRNGRKGAVSKEVSDGVCCLVWRRDLD